MRISYPIKVFFVVHSTLIVVLLLYALAYSVPETTVPISKTSKVRAVGVLPEGWAFFTKDPKEDETVVYSYDASHQQLSQITQICGSWNYAFGLNRASRMQVHETAFFKNLVPKTDWVHINGKPSDQISRIAVLPSLRINNPSRWPYHCGDYVLQLVGPVPWSWANSENIKNYQESKICRITVICNQHE